MSMDAFPILLTDEMAMSTLCQNSLTDAQIGFAQTALRCLSPLWSLDCCETCEADLFLDLWCARPDGGLLSFVFHACDGGVRVFSMEQDVPTPLGHFDDIAPAVHAVVATIEG
jgi:hypothetical protein